MSIDRESRCDYRPPIIRRSSVCGGRRRTSEDKVESSLRWRRRSPITSGVCGNSWRPHDSNNVYYCVVGIGRRFLIALYSYGSVIISLGTIAAFTLHPTPWCVDCEFPNPWGHVHDRMDDILDLWSLTAPFISGVLGLRKGWLVPIFIVLATLIAQPLGGVPLWSLVGNEGPMIIILGVPICVFSFGVGNVIHRAANLTLRNARAHRFSAPPGHSSQSEIHTKL
jgi:hypothetical protein